MPFHFVYANVVYLFDLNGVLREVQSSSAKEDIVVMEEEFLRLRCYSNVTLCKR